MGIYSTVESGTSSFRSRFHKSISYSVNYDCNFGQAIPVLAKFVLPGDIWRIGGNALIRFLPMTSPSMTSNKFKVRYFFVPLRLLDENTDLIITGSKDGHFDKSVTIPEFNSVLTNAEKSSYHDCYKVAKHSLFDYFGIPVGDYENLKNDSYIPADYWKKAYFRIGWDYYFDENLSFAHQQGGGDFETYYSNFIDKQGFQINPFTVQLPKDYFTSSLPWQLKGVQPTILMNGIMSAVPDFGTTRDNGTYAYNKKIEAHESSDPFGNSQSADMSQMFTTPTQPSGETDPDYKPSAALWFDTDVFGSGDIVRKGIVDLQKDGITNLLKNMSVTSDMGFTADDLRSMMAQTRIFERLARTGSRYTEYLRANFGTSPADGTLQRAQYLGGWSMPIVTTEVLQTAEDGSTPVGTMRGHGISNGGNRISTFFAKEFGVIIGLAHVLPKIQYTQGISKELTYKRRFDFFNPSFQHLSEQEVKNSELYVSFTDQKNEETFGFQAYANELRTSTDKIVGDMRDGLKYWNQGIHFSSRPNLNYSFISSSTYSDNFNQSFVQVQNNPCNIIVDFYNDLDVYRPMVRYGTPGLVDHL